MKKIFIKNLSYILIIILLISNTTISFADVNLKLPKYKILDEDFDLQRYNLEKLKANFHVDGVDNKIVIPKTGSDNLMIEGSEKIEIKLPECINNVNGYIDNNKTLYYDSNIAMIKVMPLQERQGELIFDGIRSDIIIKHINSPQQYEYKYTLENNYYLISAREYSGENSGEIYIIDKEDNIIAVIDPPHAQDADGNKVDTHYELYGNTLKQVIEPNKTTVFPIVATSTTHPNKVTTSYLSKSMTKTYYESMGYGTSDSIARGAEILAIGLVPGGVPVATLMSVADLWTLAQRYKVEKLYKEMKSNQYLKITITARWRNGGKNSGYVYGSPEYTIVAESKVPASILKKIKD
ncbi:hypothetical protein ACDL92_06205 [Ihubacter sp. mB4P-1]|uniref:hypothetical protein n=1 Tax=Ihubacter sp. mB4P-1 TaxID=3242370 RepID=UPI003C7C0A9A